MEPAQMPGGLRDRRAMARSAPAEASATALPASPAVAPHLKDTPLTPIAALWVASSQDLQPEDGAVAGKPRSWSVGNIIIAIQLIQLLWWRFVDLLLRDTLRDAGVFLARKGMQGIMPAAKVWAQKEMLDIVQTSFEQPLELSHVIWVAVRSTAFDSFEGLAGLMTQGSEERFQERLNRKIAQAYLAAEMALAVPAMSSPYTAALLADAREFCHGPADTEGIVPPHDAFSSITGIARIASLLLATITQALLLLRTLAFGAGGSYFSLPSLLMLLLGLYPSAAVYLRTQIMAHYARLSSEIDQSMPALRSRLQQVRDMRLSPEFTQDVMLPRLRSWVLETGSGEQQTDLERTIRTVTATALVDWGTRLSTTSVENVLHVLLATRVLGTGFSLGSVRTFRASATSLLSTTQALGNQVDLVYQSIFQLAAFFEVTQDPRAVSLTANLNVALEHPGLDYEMCPNGRGMRIRARGLGSAQSTDAPGLKGCTFDLRPGESLSLLGDDHVSKQLFVELLLGLRSHAGELYINEQTGEAYDPRTLFARTVCLSCEVLNALSESVQHRGSGDAEKTAQPKAPSSHVGVPPGSVEQEAALVDQRRQGYSGPGILTPGGWPAAGAPHTIPSTTFSSGSAEVRALQRRLDLSQATLKLKTADLVIYDTSTIPSEATEILVIRELQRLCEDAQRTLPTIIGLTRRLSAAQVADHIFRVGNGSISVVKRPTSIDIT